MSRVQQEGGVGGGLGCVWDFKDLYSCIFETFMEVQLTTKRAHETCFLN